MPRLDDPNVVRERNKRLRADENAQDEMLKALLDVPQGRRWIYGLLEKCHPYQTPFSKDALTMAFLAGEQNIGLWLIAQIMRVSPSMYYQMMREAGEKNEVRDEISELGSGEREWDPTDPNG